MRSRRAHPGVSAGGLRRRRRARRVPRPGAAPAGRRRRALLRGARATSRRARLRDPGRAGRRQRRAADARRSTSRSPPRSPGATSLHSHTWYANLAGVLGGLLHGVPHVLTAHSLEPQRPWKAEQLGGGYRVSSWAERRRTDRRRGHRGQRRHASRHPRGLPVRGPGPGARDPQRHRHRRCTRRLADDRRARRSYGIDPNRPYVDLRRADHPAEGRRAPARGGAAASTRTSSWCCAPARRTRRRSRAETERPSPSCAGAAPG